MSISEKDLKDMYRLYAVELNIGFGRWQKKGDIRLLPGARVQEQAEALARLHQQDLRLVLVHPVPPVVYIAQAKGPATEPDE